MSSKKSGSDENDSNPDPTSSLFDALEAAKKKREAQGQGGAPLFQQSNRNAGNGSRFTIKLILIIILGLLLLGGILWLVTQKSQKAETPAPLTRPSTQKQPSLPLPNPNEGLTSTRKLMKEKSADKAPPPAVEPATNPTIDALEHSYEMDAVNPEIEHLEEYPEDRNKDFKEPENPP